MKTAALIRRSEGSNAVEFVLVLPLLLLFTFGIIEMGLAWYSKQMLVSASREGARYGVVYSDTALSNLQVENHVTTFLTNSGYPGTFSVTSTGADGAVGDEVRVQVDSPYTFPVLSSLVPGIGLNVNLSATTIMRHE